MTTLPKASLAHHERLMRQVDRMPATGNLVGEAPADDLKVKVDELAGFLTGLLLPHMDATEATLYPELERLFQNRHSMAPMRREHGEIRRLVNELTGLRREVDAGRLPVGRMVILRRVIFRLYALLKVHLAEEQMYVGIIERGAGPEAAEALAAAMEHAGTSEF
jgi:iron-sulfur cluster repair protein YtfE (RIC family)